MIVDLLESVIQSNRSFSITEMLEIEATILKAPYGGGGRNVYPAFLSDQEIFIIKKKCIINTRPSNDMLCLPKSILLGKCLADGDNDLLRAYVRKNSTLLKKDSLKLLKKANVNVSDLGCNIFDIYKIQKHLIDYSITVYDDKTDSNNHLVKSLDRSKEINLFYLQNSKHFITLKNVKGFFNKPYQCESCKMLLANLASHVCSEICKYCKSDGICPGVDNMTHCSQCNRDFRGQHCFQQHLTTLYGEKTVCDTVFYCTLCSKIVNLRKRPNIAHICGEYTCKTCYKLVTSQHACFVSKYTKRSPQKFTLIFFDLECMQDTVLDNGKKLHVPNLCVVQEVCEKCCADTSNRCVKQYCGQHIFRGLACIEKFLNHIEHHRVSKVFCIAHNLKGYDGHFILNEMAKRNCKILPIISGTKIMKLVYNDITFIDSLNFLPMALSKFPKAFGLENIAKGYYPHFFNTLENTNYIGPLPAIEYYGLNSYDSTEKQVFERWYNENVENNFVFNNMHELEKYCSLDVTLLRKGCLKFMENFKQVLNINPFTESTTLAQAVMLGYRKQFLIPNTLSINSTNNYGLNKHQSKIGKKWLVYEKNVNGNINICFEYKIDTIFVDGYDPTTNTVYEFFGCYFHGCPKCFSFKCSKSNITERYESTMLRVHKLRNMGFNLEIKWECDFIKYLKKNPIINDRISKDYEMHYHSINCRDAIFGGRTEVFRSYYKVGPNEKIRYLDFTSLYPYVNKYCKYPTGPPRIFKRSQCFSIPNILEIDGIIKCKILPPQNLLIPILPVRIENRLCFGLCNMCMEKLNTVHSCEHSDDERALIGTWVLNEVHLALQNGYVIVDVFEIWQYDTIQYDPINKCGGLFTEYMNTFLKLKQESSGLPSSITSLDQYIQDFHAKEGILLDRENIVVNPSMRSLAKLCANSLWGKFIQRNDHSQTIVFEHPSEFYDFISSEGVDIVDVLPFGERAVWLNWKCKYSEQISPLPHESLMVGAFTTAHARIKLYHQMSQLGSDLLYCDTDSIIYIERPGQSYTPLIGNFIGDLTDEVSDYGPNSYITSFVSTGAKTYSFQVYNPDNGEISEIAKCKGISANVENRENLSFENLKKIVTETDMDYLEFTWPNKIGRNKKFQVISGPESKKIQFTQIKRICIENFETIPYGYKI